MARKLRTRKQRRAAIRDGYRYGLAVQSRQEYLEYLASPWWQNRRLVKLKSSSYRFDECGASARDGVLHVHHLHYLSLGRERNSDLEVLCEPCHKSRHPNWDARETPNPTGV